MTSDKAQLRAWLYQLMARVETTKDLAATKTEIGSSVDLHIEFDPERGK